MANGSDSEILRLISKEQGREAGFELLLDTYKERLYWHIRRMVHSHEDADDLLQEVFIKVWRKIDAFRGDSKIYTWLYRVATNETLSFLKRRKKKQTINLAGENYDLAEILRADPYFDGDDIQIRLKCAIEKLPEKQRLVFNMRYYNEMRYSEISGALGTSEGALKANYHLAVKKIEKEFKAHG